MKEYGRYAIGVIFLIGVILVIVLGVNLFRNATRNDAPEESKTTKSVSVLEAGKAGKPVRYTIRGSVVGNELHHSIRITVDGNTRRIEVLQGYNDQVIKTQQTENTQQAYEAFTAALNGAGFSNQLDPKNRGDEAQSCTTGRKFNYEISPGASDGQRTWATNCGRKQGTFAGNASLVQTLFQRQIPDYSKFVDDVQL